MRCIALIAVIFIFGCTTHQAADYSAAQCQVISDTGLAITFKKQDVERNLYISAKDEGVLTFTGASLRDLKWVKFLHEVQSVQVDEDEILSVKDVNGSNFEVGVIDNPCRLKVQRVVGALYRDITAKQ